MALTDFIQFARNGFKYQPVDTDRIRRPLPQVTLFGYEKAYGAPHPEDFALQVQQYKSWVYACAWKNATSVAKCKLCLYKQTVGKDGDEELDKVYEHPFLDVINKVNPFSNKFELFTITQTFMELTGNSYWWMPRDNLGVPYMIWCIPSHWVKIVPSKERFIEGYVVTVPGKTAVPIPFDEEEVVHFKFPSPFSLFYGTGPTIAAQFGVDLNKHMKTWGINYFLNDAKPGGVLTTETSLSVEQYQRLRDQWNAKHRGTSNAGKMAILEGGLTYQQIGSTVRDARIEFVAKEVRDEILAIFGVPASKLGLVEDVNRANADANDYTYQKETILPRLTLIEEKLNEKLISKYPQDNGGRLICKFENPVPEDNAVKLAERTANIASGYSTIDEEREKDGLEPFNLPETSKPLIPFNLVPAGSPKPETDAMGNPIQGATEDDSDEKKGIVVKSQKWEVFANITAPQEKLYAGVVKRFFESQHGEVMRKLHNFKAVQKDLFTSIVFNQKEQVAKLKVMSLPNINAAITSGLVLGAKETGTSINFTLFNPNILRMTEARANFVAEKINESTATLLQDALNEGIKNGESISDIAKRVDNIYSFSGDFRSKRIAQTEIIGATNEGQLKAYDEAGIKQKEWLTAGDEKVRDSHSTMNGQVVDLHQSFTSGFGAKLQYPGDRSVGVDPSEVINCRCTVIPVVKL